MEKMKDLKDLLRHEIEDLYSAEEQIIEAMPAMIEKANDPSLKKALKEHLKITENQRNRLNKVQKLLSEKEGEETTEEKKTGLLGRLFGGGAQKCKGMEGLITEGEKVMKEDMNGDVMDAAIISCAQKIEHYEICGYGTAKAYARELNLGQVAELLEETLNEEYEADDRLTDLAVTRLNKEAERGTAANKRSSSRGGSQGSNRGKASSSSGRSGAKKGSSSSKSGSSSKKSGSSGSASRKGGTSKSAGKSGSKGAAAKKTTGSRRR
jgi:ferritin-like metal-binding protein YciE